MSGPAEFGSDALQSPDAGTGRPNMPATGPGPGVRDMSPACFGMVMATGILSLAAHNAGREVAAFALFWLAGAAYALLWVLSVLRALRHTRRFLGDMTDHLRGPGFFTTVAASGVLGSQFVILAQNPALGFAMWAVTLLLWLLLTYTIFAAFTVKAQKPGLQKGINGGWLLAVVATQSVSVLSALLAARVDPAMRLDLNFLALSMWLCGGMLYIWIISLVFYRYTFFRLLPADLSPPYWINMGAMAISTLAGALLVQNSHDAPFLHALAPFLKGFTILYWATGTWWIPMLLVLGVWRYAYRRFPLRYDTLYWGMVFPLGMYSAATFQTAHVMGLDFLLSVAEVFFWAAGAAWTMTMLGFLGTALRRFRSPA